MHLRIDQIVLHSALGAYRAKRLSHPVTVSLQRRLYLCEFGLFRTVESPLRREKRGYLGYLRRYLYLPYPTSRRFGQFTGAQSVEIEYHLHEVEDFMQSQNTLFGEFRESLFILPQLRRFWKFRFGECVYEADMYGTIPLHRHMAGTRHEGAEAFEILLQIEFGRNSVLLYSCFHSSSCTFKTTIVKVFEIF